MLSLIANRYTLGAASVAMTSTWLEHTDLFSPLFTVAAILDTIAKGL